MQTPEEFARGYVGRFCPAPEPCQYCLDDSADLADLIRERDAEVRADERAKVLAGFTEEWGVELTPQPGKSHLAVSPRPTTEELARKEHAVNQEWFAEGEAAWCNAYEKSTLVRRLVGPWKLTP